MAPGVAKTFVKELVNIMRIRYDTNESKLENMKYSLKDYNANHDYHIMTDEGRQFINLIINETDKSADCNRVYQLAMKRTEDATHQAMEALIHNLNSMHSRAGAQVPFSSINFGTDTSNEGRMVSLQFLRAEEEGMGNGETPIFPISIYKLKDGVNFKKGDPNYDVKHRACEVSAKRLFPNFSNLDAPYNASYYKEGDIDTEIAYMGCVEKNEVIAYKIGDKFFVESFEKAYDRVSRIAPNKQSNGSSYLDTTGLEVYIKDTSSKGFVKCKKFIKNPNKNNWRKVELENGQCLIATEDHPLPVIETGRTFVKDINTGDHIRVSDNMLLENKNNNLDEEFAWLLGVILKNGSYSGNVVIKLADREESVTTKICLVAKRMGYSASVTDKRYRDGTRFIEICITGKDIKLLTKRITDLFEGCNKDDRHIPNEIFRSHGNIRAAFLSGMFDVEKFPKNADSSTDIIRYDPVYKTHSKEVALQTKYLVNSIGVYCNIRTKFDVNCNKYEYVLKFGQMTNMYQMVNKGKANGLKHSSLHNDNSDTNVAIKNIKEISVDSFSYDVETESDKFDVSGMCSHNCRTRVMANVYDPEYEKVTGRGNLSFTSINLPRLGIKAGGDINLFFSMLDEMLELVHRQLLDRFKVQCRKRPRNYPSLMGQGIWIGSDKLGPDDDITDILKNGTLTVGFIGLAECLKALIGKHHGESKEAQELGLRIIGHMREATDQWSQNEKMNYSIIATPAEGLSGRFVKMDKKRYGIIEGVTDREYYTNSMHVPVYFPISACRKIDIEAPYHALCNGGHITYVELDGDPSKNIKAFEKIVDYMHDKGIGYGAINHPVDRDPVCGYNGIIDDVCPRCGRKDGEPMSTEMWHRLREFAGHEHMSTYGVLGNPMEETNRTPNDSTISEDK